MTGHRCGVKDRFPIIVRVQAEGVARRSNQPGAAAVLAQKTTQVAPVGVQFTHQIGEPVFIHLPGQMLQRGTEAMAVAAERPVHNPIPRLNTKFRRRALIDNREMRRNAGFQGETGKQGFAKRVDGADTETAGRFQGFGK
jgi:hypothetical protein